MEIMHETVICSGSLLPSKTNLFLESFFVYRGKNCPFTVNIKAELTARSQSCPLSGAITRQLTKVQLPSRMRKAEDGGELCFLNTGISYGLCCSCEREEKHSTYSMCTKKVIMLTRLESIWN